MSVDAMSWAFAQALPTAARKLVLVALADQAGDDGITIRGQSGIAAMCSLSERQVRDHVGALEAAGMIARSRRQRPNKTRTSDYTILAPGRRPCERMTEPDPDEYPAAVIWIATGGAPTGGNLPVTLPAETFRGRSPLLRRGSLGPLGQTAGARGFELNGTMPVDVTDLEQRVLAAVERVGKAKRSKAGKSGTVVDLCRRFADRDLAGEAERFEHYYSEGRGENVKVRDVVARWRNWIDQAPSRQENGRAPRTAKGAERRARHERRRRMVEEAGLLQPKGME